MEMKHDLELAEIKIKASEDGQESRRKAEDSTSPKFPS